MGWSKKPPKSDGWFWVKYDGKSGQVKCPAAVKRFDFVHNPSLVFVRTARNDTFIVGRPPAAPGLRFGPPIKVPR